MNKNENNMRDSIENASLMQKKLNDLQLENQVLKNLLDQNRISYAPALRAIKTPDSTEDFDPDQGGRIIHPEMITEKMARIFFSWFWGRLDVYARRYENKNGESGYFPQCENFWKEVCPRKHRQKIQCKDCAYQAHKTLTKEDIRNHLTGRSYNASDVIGVYPLFPDGTCRFLVFDFDNHDKGAEKHDFANEDDSWTEEVDAMRSICTLNGIAPLVERSRSGKGAHIWIFFDQPVSAALVRRFGYALLDKGAEQVNLKSFRYYDRMLPAQDVLPEGGLGNLIALPLQGKALRDGNSAFIDSNWNAYPNQWEILQKTPRLSREYLELKINEWSSSVEHIDISDEADDREQPWKKSRRFSPSDVDGKMNITLSNGIFIDTLNLKPGIQNQIRRMAACANPIYYKNNAIGTSNYDTAKWIYLGRDHLSGYIEIPRGLYGELKERLTESGIPYSVEDERQGGHPINVHFLGMLREEQKPALEALAEYDTGILHAATAFGKTVVCAGLIAEKKVNTLILLESSALIDQWQESLEKFLQIDEELPEYKTKTGRTKHRKKLIGHLQAQHDSLTGIVDIAMVGSLCKKGEHHPMLNQYGMILVDECHHVASETMSDVLKEAKARYVYGVTATPKRGDGLEKINYMLLGPIRYSYTSKERAKSQGIEHLVYPRFTRTVPPRGILTERMHPNEAYEIIRDNTVRDDQIVEDIRECIDAGRTPVVLSKYKDHSGKLYERIKTYANHVFLMTGNNSKKEHKKILTQMQEVRSDESMILVATGSLIGEGFDYPRLDTLIMATPVSFRGVVEQYAGRLNRDYEGKSNVIVYDYVDSHIPMFANMYAKRLKAYKQIGYDVCMDIHGNKQSADAIFDSDNFEPVFKTDLAEARKSVVVSSPAISGPKVRELIRLMRQQQIQGVTVTVVTWAPDAYGFGDPAYWMQLHEEMRQAGFYMQLMEESCERFAVIDQEIVWYGSVNLLAKSDADASIMRILGKKVASELMELAFGKSSDL